MALDPDDCPHVHVTTVGNGPPLGPWWQVCYDCETTWPVAIAPVPGPKTDGSGINPHAVGPN
jgi:hypothetical protein